MINITIDDIQNLLNQYDKAKGWRKRHMPLLVAEVDIIARLRAFIKPLSGETGAELKAAGTQADSLSKEALYELALMLLNRKKSIRAHKAGNPTQSELVAKALEDKFEKSRMDCFRLCSQVTELNQAIFNLIWDVDSSEVLPQTITDVKAWLIAKNLLAAPLQSPSESAIMHLEKAAGLASRLSNQDLSALSQVSHGFRELFKPALDARFAEELGQLIIHADLDGAKKMIQAHPGLLTVSLIVSDYSNRKIQGTALQLALGAEDVRYHDHEIAMVEMIMGELEKQPDGERIIARQIAEQFPEGWEAEHQERVARDQAALDAFVAAIANSNNQADWEAAAVIYRKHIDNENLGKGVIKKGLHCNAQLVAAWFHAYNQNYAAFGNHWDSPKNVFLWQKGSYCQRYLTTPYAMALARGIWNIVDEGKNLERLLDFLFGGGSFFPLNIDPLSGLGFDYGGAGGWCGPRGWHAEGPRTIFSSYVRQKTSTLRRLTQERSSNLETKPHHLK